MNIQDTLNERQKTHGSFRDHADISQGLKKAAKKYTGNMCDMQVEAIEMCLHKVARICAGNPLYSDHWHDIEGYITLLKNLHDEESDALTVAQNVDLSEIEDIFAHMKHFDMQDYALAITLDIFDYISSPTLVTIDAIVSRSQSAQNMLILK